MTRNVVPMVKSSPAMGKSSIVRSIAAEFNMELIDVRLSTAVPEDLTGLPRFREILDANGNVVRTIAEFVPFEQFPTEDTPLPPGKDGWILFLDEFNSAKREVQAAAYKLVLDKMVGLKRLHPRVRIICAGNLTTDRAIVNEIGTAMQSRLCNLTMVLPTRIDEFLEDVAYPNQWDKRIIAWLTWKPTKLHEFRADHNDDNFKAPRTWDFVNELIKGVDYNLVMNDDGKTIKYYEMEEEAALLGGCIGFEGAVEFIQFTKVFHNLPQISDIEKDPLNAVIPPDSGTQYATILMLQDHANDNNLGAIVDYLDGWTAEFRTLFFRGLKINKLHLNTNPAWRRGIVSISKYLNDPISQKAAA
ncbi:AAA family ATPase [Mesorhizobium yinganensis]|uniref:AAA family ATPase n=1 Tax=Mesorhizobium yinganensis TaxID=3157707 RepID=UPI0032B6FA07